MGSLSVKTGPVEVLLIDDDRICWHLRKSGTFEPDTLAAWAEMCRPGTGVIDVGAYSGLFAIAAARMGAAVLAVEPMPVMARRIEANAALNNVIVNLVQAAASDADGPAMLGFNDNVHLTAGASLSRRSRAQLPVMQRRLDSLGLVRVDAIKIDVEGHELAVLAGAREIIARDRPRLIIEVLSDEARAGVEAALPSYCVTSFLDGRNLVLEPT